MRAILPNSKIGVFGSGQLGRMFAIEARKMGYRVHTFSPDADTPMGQVSDNEITASYEDLDQVRSFASGVDVITFEFENVPALAVDAASELVEVHPRGEVLHTTQNRRREKAFLSKNGFPIAEYRDVRTLDDLIRGLGEVGVPAVLKTAGFGYDGKGQTTIRSAEEADAGFAQLNGADGVLEAYVDFEKEVSVVCARDASGRFVHYGLIENAHSRHILDVSFAPAAVSMEVWNDGIEIAASIAEQLAYVGTLCVEFFLRRDGKLLVNEIAPRPHNSGHLTFDACRTSQFEQQLRAVCGLKFGSTDLYRPAAMANLLGELWDNGEPNWPEALTDPDIKLHLYGKSEPRTGRKMGHLTSTAEDAADAVRAVRAGRARLNS